MNVWRSVPFLTIFLSVYVCSFSEKLAATVCDDQLEQTVATQKGFSSETQATQELIEMGKAQRFSSEERDALELYTYNSYQKINATLRGRDLESRDNAYVENLIHKIDAAMAKTATLKQPVTVWRGRQFSSKAERDANLKETRAHIKSGKPLVFAEFLSTSLNFKHAERHVSFGKNNPASQGIIFEIQANRGLYLGELSSIGETNELNKIERFTNVADIRTEEELLLPRGSSFRVIKIAEKLIEGYDGTAKKRMIVHLVQL